MNNTRRNILLALAGTMPSLSVFASVSSLTGNTNIDRELQSTIQLCCPNMSDARRLGQLYLQLRPEEANLTTLQSRLGLNSASEPSGSAKVAVNRAHQVLQRHLADCATTQMVTVNGIMLSRTEARLYGLGFLLN